MKTEIRDRWVEALRSGRYMQVRGHLGVAGIGRPVRCALGVLLDLAVKDGIIDPPAVARGGELLYERATDGLIPSDVYRWADLSPDRENFIVYMNDIKLASFDEIASYIQEDL